MQNTNRSERQRMEYVRLDTGLSSRAETQVETPATYGRVWPAPGASSNDPAGLPEVVFPLHPEKCGDVS
ncbi:MAG TPA: hypothetical protein VMH85_17510, partial [Terriglobales bacterium]|nr:hypothetical protein [Terriglobales bacterium]